MEGKDKNSSRDIKFHPFQFVRVPNGTEHEQGVPVIHSSIDWSERDLFYLSSNCVCVVLKTDGNDIHQKRLGFVRPSRQILAHLFGWGIFSRKNSSLLKRKEKKVVSKRPNPFEKPILRESIYCYNINRYLSWPRFGYCMHASPPVLGIRNFLTINFLVLFSSSLNTWMATPINTFLSLSHLSPYTATPIADSLKAIGTNNKYLIICLYSHTS